MASGFPLRLLPLVRCAGDGGALESTTSGHAGLLETGLVRCRICSREYAVRDGILVLLAEAELHPESTIEMRKRDEKAEHVARSREWSSRYADLTEVAPTLEALEPYARAVVAEHGCGTGRYTIRLAAKASAVVAVDFSRASLAVLREKLSPGSTVALVQADVTRAHLAPGAFDRVLSTLHSNLPTRDHRLAALRQSAGALGAGGRAVISMHHYGLRDLLQLQPRAGRYADTGIYRYYMRSGEATAEASEVFREVALTYLRASVPGVPSVALPRLLGGVPVLRTALAQLMLASCERPRG